MNKRVDSRHNAGFYLLFFKIAWAVAQRALQSYRMNGFSTEEDSHDGPPAPPFYGQSCCLIEDGERCGRSAGNASFSKRIQKSISQKKLKLDIDKSVSKKKK